MNGETIRIMRGLSPWDFFLDLGDGDLRPFRSFSPELQREVSDEKATAPATGPAETTETD